jgi:hypothetical protein
MRLYIKYGQADTPPPLVAAIAPDGALYTSEDVHGRIWRITSSGSHETSVVAAPDEPIVAASSNDASPPEGIHPDAGLPSVSVFVG